MKRLISDYASADEWYESLSVLQRWAVNNSHSSRNELWVTLSAIEREFTRDEREAAMQEMERQMQEVVGDV